jgi:predicted RND superfamily exporter protein
MTAARWAALIERHHRAILIGSLLLGALAALSLTRLRLDVDVLSMLPRGTPAFDDFKTFIAEFGQLDELVILVDGPAADRVRFADALSERLAALPEMARVQGRLDPQAVADALLGPYLPNYLPLDAFPQVEQRLTPDGIARQVQVDKAMLAAPFDVSLPRMVAADPLGLRPIAARGLAAASPDAAALDGGYITSQDGGALLLLARPNGSPFDIELSRRVVAETRAAIAATQAELGGAPLRVELTGGYVFALEDATTMRDDIVRFSLLAFVGVLLVFWLGYGNLRALPFLIWPLLLSSLFAFALSLLLFDELNAISLSFAAILYGLAIDSGIHFYSRYLQELGQQLHTETRRHGEEQEQSSNSVLRASAPPCDDSPAIDAVARTLASLGPANVASSGTTAAAFLVIALSALGAVHQLGVLTALGMFVTSAEFFILYPALAFWLLRAPRGGRRDLRTPRLAAWATAARRRSGAVRLTVLVLTAGAALAATRLYLDPSLNRLRPADSPALRVQEELSQRFTRSATGALLVRGADADTALAAGERVAARLREWRREGAVERVQSVDALLPSGVVQRDRLALWNQLPREAAAQTLRDELRKQGFALPPFEPALERLAAPQTAIVRRGDPALDPIAPLIDRHLRLRADGAGAAIYVEPKAEGGWPALADRVHRELPEAAVAARALLEDTLHGVLQRELLLFVGLSTLANLLLLLAVLRDGATAIAVLIPDLAVIVVLFGLMGVAGVPVDPINLVVTPLVLGIGVDNCVYVATLTRQFGSVGAALRVAGRAIAVTSSTTIIGFGVLGFSTYPPLATMGRLVALGLTISLVATILLLPALLPKKTEPRMNTDEHR